MGRKEGYNLEDVEFKGKAYRKMAVVRYHNKSKSSASGMISLPERFVGKLFDIILIEKESDEGERKENNESPTEKT